MWVYRRFPRETSFLSSFHTPVLVKRLKKWLVKPILDISRVTFSDSYYMWVIADLHLPSIKIKPSFFTHRSSLKDFEYARRNLHFTSPKLPCQARITCGLSQKNSRDVKTKLNQILFNYLVKFGFDISRVFLR